MAGSDWAAEFRQRIEESEGKSKATEDFESVDESLEEEEEKTELEEPQGEAEEETEKVRESGELEPEEGPVKPVAVDVGKRAVDMMNAMTGQKEPAKRSSGGNPMGAALLALMGLLMLQSLPSIFNTVSSAFQPLMASGGSNPQGYYPVQCQYCGYQCLGYNGMLCPRCGRS